jgi:hypothetical protein
MQSFFVRRRSLLGGLVAAVALAACTDKRLQAVDTGMDRNQVLSQLSHDLKPGSGPDSLPNVYRTDRYIIAGKNYEVLYFMPDNKKMGGKDTIPYRKLTPIVMVDNKVVAKGWRSFDSLSTANKIPLKPE